MSDPRARLRKEGPSTVPMASNGPGSPLVPRDSELSSWGGVHRLPARFLLDHKVGTGTGCPDAPHEPASPLGSPGKKLPLRIPALWAKSSQQMVLYKSHVCMRNSEMKT